MGFAGKAKAWADFVKMGLKMQMKHKGAFGSFSSQGWCSWLPLKAQDHPSTSFRCSSAAVKEPAAPDCQSGQGDNLASKPLINTSGH